MGRSGCGTGNLRTARAALRSACGLCRSGREESRPYSCEFLRIQSFPNYLQGSKYGGCCMNELELDNITCVELLSSSEKMLSKYIVFTSKIMIQYSIYSAVLPTCQLFPRDVGKMNGQDLGKVL